ncbi:ABC transporter ATP-binding protein [Microbacterium sp. SORGH_AS_0888]|uniref:ABC transporter ATP-binding protein n=1 Tax=Microbacterium sp. SORGH_AS_0888 TaxID=3041791 RepID=UPI002780BEE1|nr:ABC transporter ATP-binding protein [Microbacterium sp. SORGH_AS_0888]MDQ1129692.1 branched-chain amino acid transport system ATP-binding protein [Microbacterium sp. SORGH_AS_0888]
MTGDTLLEVQDVELAIGGLQILRGVSFAVRRDEFFTVIGPNGAGKTSLLNVLSRIYRPTRGSVRFGDVDLLAQHRTALSGLGIARTFQNLALFDDMDVMDNVVLGRHRLMRSGVATGAVWFGRARREERLARQACEPLIDLLGLGDHLTRPVRDLPYGIKKRIELARALAVDPTLLLLDEPAAGMNDEETDELAEWILVAKRELGLTVVMIEHDMGMVTRLGDRSLVLDFGTVITVEAPSVAIADPRVISAYLGDDSDEPEDPTETGNIALRIPRHSRRRKGGVR